jgi:hypothetical protein
MSRRVGFTTTTTTTTRMRSAIQPKLARIANTDWANVVVVVVEDVVQQPIRHEQQQLQRGAGGGWRERGRKGMAMRREEVDASTCLCACVLRVVGVVEMDFGGSLGGVRTSERGDLRKRATALRLAFVVVVLLVLSSSFPSCVLQHTPLPITHLHAYTQLARSHPYYGVEPYLHGP